MDIFEGIQTRRSIRKFQDIKISHDVFEEIVRLTSCAPSWKNTQIARYILLEDDALIKRLAIEGVPGFQFNVNTIQNAPNVVVVSYVTQRSGYERDGSFSTSKEDRWEMFDAGIASQTLCLAAHGKGYGTVIMGVFDEQKVAGLVGLPETQKVAAIIPIGLPAEAPPIPKRKSVEDLITYR